MKVFLAGLLAAVALAPVSADDRLVTANGGSAAAHAWSGSPVPFWIRVQNNGQESLVNVSLRLLGTDATISALCWQSAAAAACGPDPGTTQPGGLLFARGELTPSASGDWRPQMLLFWGGPSALHETTIPLGPLKVENYAWSWAQSLSSALKDLALPIALAFVGYVYQRRLQTGQEEARKQERDLEQRRLDQERELDASRQAEDRKRAERAETLRIMLPQCHAYATEYYATLEMRSRNLVDSAKAYRDLIAAHPADHAATDAALAKVTFDVAALYHANRLLTRDVGAYYFKDRMGEELVAGAFAAMDGSMFDGHDQAGLALTTILNALKPEMLLPHGDFLEAMDKASDHTKASLRLFSRRVGDWMTEASCGDCLACISLYRAVLQFEMNRPYENWYGVLEQLDLEDWEFAAVDVVAKRRPKYADRVRRYVEENRRRPT